MLGGEKEAGEVGDEDCWEQQWSEWTREKAAAQHKGSEFL